MFPEGKVRPMIATISNAALYSSSENFEKTQKSTGASASLETTFAGAGGGIFRR